MPTDFMMPGPGGGAGPLTGMAPNPTAPSPERTGGATMPIDPKGLLEAVKVNVKIAMTLLEQALPAFGSDSEEGGSLMKALQSLSKKFGKQTAEDLTTAQLQNMFSQMPKPGGPPPGAPPQGGPPPGGPPPDLMKLLGGR